MPVEVKTVTLSELKVDGEGEGTFEAVFATMNVVDSDDDLTLPGAFGNQRVKISQYNHGSWGKGSAALPVGIGEIFERGDQAVVRGKLNLKSRDGRETYETLKFIAEAGHVQEWSYALPKVDYEYRDVDGRRVRVLKRIQVPEVSPVLMGAGVGTDLLSVKQKDEGVRFVEEIDATKEAVESVVKRAEEISTWRISQGKTKGVGDTSRAHLAGLVDVFTKAASDLDALLTDAKEEPEADISAELANLKQRFELITIKGAANAEQGTGRQKERVRSENEEAS